MTVFRMKKVKQFELWKKAQFMMSAVYTAEKDAAEKDYKLTGNMQKVAVLSKQDILVIQTILTDENINDPIILDLLQKDVKAIMDFELSNFSQQQRNEYQALSKQEMEKGL